MKNDINKLKFEKPEIFEAQFIFCQVPVLSSKVPRAVIIATTCMAPVVSAEIPTALIY